MKNNQFKIVGILFCLFSYTSAQTIEFNGQLISWLTMNPFNDFKAQSGVRYIPSLNFEKNIKKQKFDTEISFNTYLTGDFKNDTLNFNEKLKPYRLSVRLSSDQYEIRLGLQKINFGSAYLLRPLMWFDQIDPRDPLQLTDGVYGLLFKYYFLNNANIWLWGLLGNENTKGWEFYPSNKKRLEFGGRFQHPALGGELALSFHNREVDYSKLLADTSFTPIDSSNENRLGIDGKWDIGIGLWFEGIVKYQNIAKENLPWQQQFNVGLDYTFSIGNGLSIVKEFLWFGISEDFLNNTNNIAFSALSLNYPVSILDNITGMIYYDWTNNEIYRFINWQRMYDKISLYLMLFWNPERFNIYQNLEQENLFSGTGFQFMFVFNH